MKFPGELHGPFIDIDKGHKVCTVCDQMLTNGQLDQYCTGKGYYARSYDVPANLKTEPTWREEGFRPARGEKAKAWLFSYVYGQGHFWARLWDEKQVVAIKRRKPKREFYGQNHDYSPCEPGKHIYSDNCWCDICGEKLQDCG